MVWVKKVGIYSLRTKVVWYSMIWYKNGKSSIDNMVWYFKKLNQVNMSGGKGNYVKTIMTVVFFHIHWITIDPGYNSNKLYWEFCPENAKSFISEYLIFNCAIIAAE